MDSEMFWSSMKSNLVDISKADMMIVRVNEINIGHLHWVPSESVPSQMITVLVFTGTADYGFMLDWD